jgi:hypothetical protein
MDWCVSSFDSANHNPVAVFNHDVDNDFVLLHAKPGEIKELDGSASFDPDGDQIHYNWFVYPEASTYKKEISIQNKNNSKASITLPKDTGSHEIHVVLEVKDQNKKVQLSDYRRIIIKIQ